MKANLDMYAYVDDKKEGSRWLFKYRQFRNLEG